MMPENNQNSCHFADELISYLYDESSQAEKSQFESHLAGCSFCADELTEFSLTRSSIIEWRETEFQPLALPSIELPVRESIIIAEISDSPSLLERVRALLNLSPMWKGAAVAATLLICGGLFFATINLRKADETSRINTGEDTETFSSPKTEQRAEIAEVKIVDPDNQNDSAKQSEIIPSENPKRVNEKSSPVMANRNAVSVKNIPPTIKDSKPRVDKTVKQPKPVLKRSDQSPSPTLIADEDDYEDDSLRLSDIFKEVGMITPKRND